MPFPKYGRHTLLSNNTSIIELLYSVTSAATKQREIVFQIEFTKHTIFIMQPSTLQRGKVRAVGILEIYTSVYAY